jgi:hypothetical protein
MDNSFIRAFTCNSETLVAKDFMTKLKLCGHLGVEIFKSELNSYLVYKFQGKKNVFE